MSSERKINSVALIGYGYWGQKLARKFHDLGVLNSIYDADPARLKAAVSDHQLPDCIDIDSDAVAIVTPPETHYEMVKEYLGYGRHVFCEKPLATTYEQAVELEELAISKGLRLQVGFIYLYNTGLMAIPQPIGPTRLYIRLRNVAGAPSDSTRELKWAGLPHALSICVHFLGHWPDRIISRSSDHQLSMILVFDKIRSKCYIDVADFTGVRQRGVYIDSTVGRYLFDADDPNYFMNVDRHERCQVREVEPLMFEIEDFLTGEVLTDRLGSKVTSLTEQICF